jgi:hypothetical protein
VDAAFDELLRQGPPTLTKKPSLTLRDEAPDEAQPVEEPEAEEDAEEAAERVEEATAQQVDAAFERLLAQQAMGGGEGDAGSSEVRPEPDQPPQASWWGMRADACKVPTCLWPW